VRSGGMNSRHYCCLYNSLVDLLSANVPDARLARLPRRTLEILMNN
jgi:hypothetical protein